MKAGILVAAVMLAGCVSLRGADSVWQQADEAADALRRGLAEVEAGGTPDFAEAAALLERAQATALVRAAGSGDAAAAALGVTLGFCREGVGRLQALQGAAPATTAALAGALRVGCLMPLALLAA
jgi:hypothetical protein